MKEKSIANIIAKILAVFFMSLMFIYCLTLIFPIIWLVINSLKSNADFIDYSSLWLPQTEWYFGNYTDIFSILKYTVDTTQYRITYDLWDMTSVSLQYSIGTMLYVVVTLTTTSYACGRYDFWLTKLLRRVGILMMIIPFTTDGGVSLILKKTLGIYDNLWMSILFSGGCIFTGQFFFIMVEHFANLGKEFAEAAQIDGASELQIYLKIMLPISKPIITVVAVLSFITAWNNYGTFLYYLPSYANLAMGMYDFQNMAPILGYSTPQVLAGFVIIAIPIVAMYIPAQKVIAKNMTIGGLKG